jgi:hypothetical protein
MGFQYNVRSDKDTHFTGAIAQNAGEDESITLPGCLAGINGNARGNVKSITVISDQNLAWELNLWRSATHGTADIDTDKWLARWAFVAADGVQLAGAGSYLYYIDSLDIPYVDSDNSGKLHVTLTNRSATAKNAGATGEVIVDVRIQPPVFGWSGS